MALNFANNNSLSAITTIPASISGGGLNLISTQTASDSSTISFTSGIDSTYKEYIIKFINVHPNSNDQQLLINFSTDGGSNYNTTKTTTVFRVGHAEYGSGTELAYQTAQDLAQSTSAQSIFYTANQDEASQSGFIHLFEPSSSVFVKHFMGFTSSDRNTQCEQQWFAGYNNTTSPINAFQFSTNTSTIGTGTFKLYGVT